jgi:hypothetical protein
VLDGDSSTAISVAVRLFGSYVEVTAMSKVSSQNFVDWEKCGAEKNRYYIYTAKIAFLATKIL